MQTDAWGSFQPHWYMEDRDILLVEMEDSLHDDSVVVRLYSRHFDYRGSLAFTYMEAPPPQPTVNTVMAALGPLFHAYARMPFAKSVTRPLLQATMDRLLPELYRAIRSTLHPILRPPPRRLVPFEGRPPVENYWAQAETSQRHMERIEAAFRQQREVADGSLVSLARGEIVRPRAEPGVFLDPESFDPARRRSRAVDVRLANHIQMFRNAVAMDIEQALFYGTAFRSEPRGFSQEAVARARETLVHCLSAVQRAEFERSNQFTVVAQNGRMYKVLPKESYNVQDDEYEYCCVPTTPCPLFDKMLASKLWLEAQFEEFMEKANKALLFRSGGRRAPLGPHPRMHFGLDPAMAVRNPTAIARLTGA